ncbi:hypothetical protein AB4Y85_12605 [Microvirga sp. 2YAF29]|uniref:hypothetical protein n=1 Tax=Microvirga sp. 2YAF29 TaxID=3233031 RepID=UPI003F948DC7
MPALFALLGTLGVAAFWFYRTRNLGGVAGRLVDAAQRARQAYRRKQFFTRDENSPIEAVTDPAAAVVAMLISLAAERGSLSTASEEAIKAEMQHTMGLVAVEEIFTFSKWVASHTTDPNILSLRFAKLWHENLQPSERADVHEMAKRIVAANGAPNDAQLSALRTLQDRLGLTRP